MVAIRSAHINKDEEFNLERWVDSLHQGQKTENKLKKLYGECQEMLVGHERKELLLWRGREMIEILITLSMDRATLQAAMLFPVVSSGLFDAEELKERYGQEIMKLIEGVEEMAAIGQLNSSLDGSGASGQVDNVRRMLLAMVDDFRCVVIKLAERICNLREVKNAPIEVRQRVAKECANIYAPLANRLGIGQLKWEIEDYAFRYQHPDIYKKIAKQLAERRIDREKYIKDFVDDLELEMGKSNIKAEVSGRPKHIFSIWRKMQKKKLAFDELFDVRAVRIMLTNCKTVMALWVWCIPNISTCQVSSMTMWQTLSQTVINLSIPWCLAQKARPLKSRSVPSRCMRIRNWVLLLTGSTKRAVRVAAVVMMRRSLGYVSFWIGKKRCQTLVKCWMSFAVRCLMTVSMPLLRVAMSLTYLWGRRL